jgi:hypothetical protein
VIRVPGVVGPGSADEIEQGPVEEGLVAVVEAVGGGVTRIGSVVVLGSDWCEGGAESALAA